MFEATGVELEYMIVDRDTLDVKPVTDQLLKEIAGSFVNEIERGEIAWSNELVLHVVELKTNGPARDLTELHQTFQQQVNEINELLVSHNARLMPSAMHPWMNPDSEMKLWPHEYNPIYEAYNRIFDCRGHGWANLQSTHINLPFAGDEEFEKLHAAIRVLLPVLPAIAASSPLADLKKMNYIDYRLEVYRTNSKRIPSVTGYIVPEAVFSEQEYSEHIFRRMYRDIDPFDPDKILQDEWLNSRGAIARFDRGSIEIRLLDIQECPIADLAIVRLITDVLKALVDEEWSSIEEQKSWNEQRLYSILMEVVKGGESVKIADQDYLSLFGIERNNNVAVSELWRHLFDELYSAEEIAGDPVLQCLDQMIASGTLSTRITSALPDNFTKTEVKEVYRQLCDCLEEGVLFGTDE